MIELEDMSFLETRIYVFNFYFTPSIYIGQGEMNNQIGGGNTEKQSIIHEVHVQKNLASSTFACPGA